MLLTQALETIGMNIKDIYFRNVVKYFKVRVFKNFYDARMRMNAT
jgi:hypothetical protein